MDWRIAGRCNRSSLSSAFQTLNIWCTDTTQTKTKMATRLHQMQSPHPGKKNNKSHFLKIKTILSHFMFGWNNITAPIISFQFHQLLTHLWTTKRGSAIFVPAAIIFFAFSWNLAIKYTKQSAITVNYFKFLQWIADFLWIFKRKDNLVDKLMEEGSLFSSTALTIFNQNAPNFVHKSSEQLSNIPHFLKFLKPTAIFLSNLKNEATVMPLCSWNIGISFKIAWKKRNNKTGECVIDSFWRVRSIGRATAFPSCRLASWKSPGGINCTNEWSVVYPAHAPLIRTTILVHSYHPGR